MTVLVFQVYFYTVLVVEKKTKFSTKSPRKYAIFTPKSQKKISGDGTLPLLRLLHLWGGGHPLLTPYTPWRLQRLESGRAFGAQPCLPTSTPGSAYDIVFSWSCVRFA